jgi:choline dehydrogenase-like flavoprotein
VGVALDSRSWGDELLETVQSAYGSHVGVGALVEQLPRRDSYVTLDTSRTDPFGNPVPAVHWRVDDATRRAIRRANEIQRRILSTLGADVEWTVGPENTGPAFHQMGTTRMGTDPGASVVDEQLRTHDLSNLWLVGSSVFPTGGAMNPTLTIAALSLRAAEALDGAL